MQSHKDHAALSYPTFGRMSTLFALARERKPQTHRRRIIFAAFLCGWVASWSGCTNRQSSEPEQAAVPPPLVWSTEGVEFHGATIRLGYRAATTSADRSVEPVAAISRGGAPAPDAMVFITLIATGSEAREEQATNNESATLYEPPDQQTPGLYTAGRRQRPDNSEAHAVRFRVVLPEIEEDFTREIPLP
jgi:hypothetical protein